MNIKLYYDENDAAQSQAARLFKKYNKAYQVAEEGDAAIRFVMKRDASLVEESYAIRMGASEITLSAGDKLGFTYGVGRILHRGISRLQDECTIPEKKMRGIYFATHFYNYYQTAPLQKLRDYMEELALWGCNSVAAWFDMHHFASIKDPAAIELLDRIKAIYEYAKELGLKICLGTLANEYYAGADKELLASNDIEGTGYTAKPSGFYHTELCPANPKAVQLLLDSHREVIEYFAGIDFDYVWLWPYDQGGCTCAHCRPWGSNGFIRISKELSKMIKEICPDTQIILSQWRFDIFTKGEWDGFVAGFDDYKDYFDAFMIDFDVPNVPEALYQKAAEHHIAITSFPEISMVATPWGGFGGTPIPYRFAKGYAPTAHRHTGGFAYSEGIFEDINKVVVLGLYVGKDSVAEIIRDYFSYYFSEAAAEDGEEFLQCLESTIPRNRYNDKGEKENYPPAGPVDYLPTFRHIHPEKIDRAFELAEKIKSTLTEQEAESDRFLMLYLRAVIDKALKEHDGALSDTTEAAAQKLEQIFYAQTADYAVSPITRKAIKENRGHI